MGNIFFIFLFFIQQYRKYLDGHVTELEKKFPLLSMIIQMNQIGSVTESIEAVKMSKHAGWGVVASHQRYDMSTIFQPSPPPRANTHTKIKTLALAFVLLMLSLCSM